MLKLLFVDMKNHQTNLVVGVLEQSLELRALFNIFRALQPTVGVFFVPADASVGF